MTAEATEQQVGVLRAETDEWEAWRDYASAAQRRETPARRRELFARALRALERTRDAERVSGGVS